MNDKIKAAFDRIQADEELKEHTKKFLFQKTQGYKKRHSFSYKQIIIAVTCFFFVLLGLGHSIYFTTVSAISIDVNPSVELSINWFDKVIFTKTYNEDGNEILSNVNVRFLNYKEALKHILEDKSLAQYLIQDQFIAVTVCNANEKKENQMLTNLINCTTSYDNVHCSSGNSEEIAAAHTAGLSFGKYRAFLELQALDSNVTIEDIKDLTMRQIRDKIAALSDDTEITQNNIKQGNNEQDVGMGNGYGRGNGNGCRRGNGCKNKE